MPQMPQMPQMAQMAQMPQMAQMVADADALERERTYRLRARVNRRDVPPMR
jgi:hypothetical protein